MKKTDNTESKKDCEYIEKEVDLAFYKDFAAEGDAGYKNMQNASCQRISHCSCDCNRTTCFVIDG